MPDEHLDIEKQLDLLETDCQQLLNLLRDRHVGLQTWRFLVGQRASDVIAHFRELGMLDD